jgi:hypothetical protein
MIQLTFLNGPAAGRAAVTRRLPFSLGRSKTANLCLNEPGIWDRHLVLTAPATGGIMLESGPEALTLVNGEVVRNARLRNGDVIEVGSLRLRFGLAPTRQPDLRLREGLTWVGWVALAAAQIVLVYQLLP